MKEGKTTTGNAFLVHQDNNKNANKYLRWRWWCDEDCGGAQSGGEEKVYKVMRLATITRKDVVVVVVFGDNFPCPPINNKRYR